MCHFPKFFIRPPKMSAVLVNSTEGVCRYAERRVGGKCAIFGGLTFDGAGNYAFDYMLLAKGIKDDNGQNGKD